LFISIFFFDSTYDDINSLKDNKIFFGLIFLLIIYSLLTYFKNIYRVLTIKTYSPMTRALTESIVDPFEIIYQLFIHKEELKINSRVLYYILILICLFITSFLSLVYNDFIVLYCCGLEYNTYLEIHKRAISYENINSGIIDEDNLFNEEENKYEKTELPIK